MEPTRYTTVPSSRYKPIKSRKIPVDVFFEATQGLVRGTPTPDWAGPTPKTITETRAEAESVFCGDDERYYLLNRDIYVEAIAAFGENNSRVAYW